MTIQCVTRRSLVSLGITAAAAANASPAAGAEITRSKPKVPDELARSQSDVSAISANPYLDTVSDWAWSAWMIGADTGSDGLNPGEPGA